MLVLLNPDPENLFGGDPDHDFAVVIEPLEKARLALPRTLLSSSNVSVGDTFNLTISLTNYGNAAAQGTHMYTDYQRGFVPLLYFSNLLELISGPAPAEIASIPPGGSAQINYSFKAIDAGTNTFWGRIGRTVCDGTRFQQFTFTIGPQVITSGIIVNSTGDLPDLDPDDCCCDTGETLEDGETPECTLRAAIEMANRLPGRDTIKFAIPGEDPGVVLGVPLIRPETALPRITNSVIIDGWSQAPNSKTPPIVLAGERIQRPALPPPGRTEFSEDLMNWNGSAIGLALSADNSEVRGLVIHSFPLCGLGIGGGATNCVIQGNFIGTDRAGTRPLANGLGADSPEFIRGCGIFISSSGNFVGGAGLHGGNLISGATGTIWDGLPTLTRYAPPGILIATDTASNNLVQGNLIGTDVSGEHLMAYTTGEAGTVSGALAGVWIASAPGNVVGGEGTAAGNVISGNLVGVRITGGAEDNRVSHNFIGCDANGALPIPNGCGVWVALAGGNVIGGDSMSAANIISGNRLGVIVQGPEAAGNVISWNVIGLNNRPGTAAEAALPNTGGILLWQGSQATTISNNRIGYNRKVGIHIEDSDANLLANNLINFNGREDDLLGAGIRISQGVANRITANSIYANQGLGITFSSSGAPTPNDSGDNDQGPNHLQNYPVMDPRPDLGADPSPGDYLLEFFGNSVVSPTGYGEGEDFLGAVTVTVKPGTPVEIATLPFTPEPGTYLTVTLTAPDGSTSEFSKATLVQDCEPGIKGLCPGTEAKVPSLGSGSGALVFDAVGLLSSTSLPPHPQRSGLPASQPQGNQSDSGAGNGDGILDSQQANVASLPGIAGVWMTLAAPNGTVLERVQSSGPPEFTNRPQGCTFPIGFLSFGITNLPAGGTLAVTNYIHLDAAPGFSYAPTTFFNYGPTPDDPTPHWYEFKFDGTTGAELLPDRIILHLRDGARGDGDLTANGEILTLGAPAYQISPGPGLRLTSTVTGMRESIGLNHTSQHVKTNVVPVVTSVLSWPTSATNWTLYFKNDLTSSDSILTNNLVAFLDSLWQPVPESPVVVNDHYMVTNTAIGPSRFYRRKLSSFPKQPGRLGSALINLNAHPLPQ
ncbi:MAG: choice-of-anchor U domain-containing protein [Verrucomicrobiia bacterium]